MENRGYPDHSFGNRPNEYCPHLSGINLAKPHLYCNIHPGQLDLFSHRFAMILSKLQRTAVIAALIAGGAIILAVLGILLFISPQTGISVQLNLTISDGQVQITHAGGESLRCDMLAIIVNGEPILFPSENTGECHWSIGETVTIPVEPEDRAQKIRILYGPANRQTELMHAEIPGKAPMKEIPSVPGPATSQEVLHGAPAPTPPQTTIPIPVSTPGIPSALFSAEPRSGPLPLTVHFVDLSTGVPDAWTWSFGDGTDSEEQNPVYTYTRTGSYTVSLNARNRYGGHSRIMQGFISVAAADEREVVVDVARGGWVEAGGFFQWKTGPEGGKVKIGGRVLEIPGGDTVRLVVEAPGKGKISVRNGTVLAFSFDDVSLHENGIFRARGSIREIAVPGSGFISSLALNIPAGPGAGRVLEGGVPVPDAAVGSALRVSSTRPGGDGDLSLDCSRHDSTYFQGFATALSS